MPKNKVVPIEEAMSHIKSDIARREARPDSHIRSRREASLVDVLYETFLIPAASAIVKVVTIGLGYTAVETDGDRLGLSYTMAGDPVRGSQLRKQRDYDGAPASEVLECVRSGDTLQRSIGIALVNALT